MPAANLTDAFVRSAKAKGGKVTEYPDKKERGLALRVMPSGEKSWTFRYRNMARQQKRMSLGKLDTITLAEARSLTIEHRATVAKGGDPAEDAKAGVREAITASQGLAIAELGNRYFKLCETGGHKKKGKPKRSSTLQPERFYFDRHIVPNLGKLRANALTNDRVQLFIDDLTTEHAPSAARHCKAVLHGMFSYATWKKIVDANPCEDVDVPIVVARERQLTDEEIRAIWAALTPPIDTKGLSVSINVACSILLALVTLQRRTEITGMKLSELDFERKTWTIPSERTKNGRTHIVPLSDLAIELIQRALDHRLADSEFVFPSPRDPSQPVAGQAMTRAFRRMRMALRLEDMRPHDLRRTGATNMTGEHIGIPRFIVSLVLNHASDTGGSRVTGIYDRNEYTPQKRRALDAWAAYLLQITGENSST